MASAMALMTVLVSVLAFTAHSQAPTPAPPVVPNSNDAETAAKWVKATNIYRCMHGVGKVGWSPEAAADAQKYVDTLTVMTPSNSYLLPPPEGPAAESQAQGFPTVEEAVRFWHSEVQNCLTLPGCKDPKALGQYTKHFTALVWKGVTRIGCATNTNTAKTLQSLIGICRYTSGDKVGPWTANNDMATDPNYARETQYGFAESVFPATKTYEECEASASSELSPNDLPDPVSLYPGTSQVGEDQLRSRWAAGNLGRVMRDRKLERHVIIVFLCVLACCCLCGGCYACRFISHEKEKALPGTLYSMQTDKHQPEHKEWRYDRYHKSEEERLDTRSFKDTMKDSFKGVNVLVTGVDEKNLTHTKR